MKLGIIGGNDKESIDRAKKLGLDFIECDVNVGEDVDGFLERSKEIVNYSKRKGIAFGAVGRWGSIRIDKDGIIEEELQNDLKLIEAASILGAPVYITGCNYVEEISYFQNCIYAMEFFQKLMDAGKDKGVKIAVYNCRWKNFVCDDMAWTIIHGHLKDLGIKYDPSHCVYAGGNYIDEMNKWGDRFYHVHVKGSLSTSEGERIDDPPAGLDQTNWGAYMGILYKKGYDGNIAIEPHSATWQGELGEKGVKFTVDYIKKFIF